MRSKSARSKKSRASQKREAIFWRPRFTWPLRAGKRANANFACSEGSFCPACRAIWQAGRSCAASRCCGGFCARCSGVFLPAAPGGRAGGLLPRVRLLRRCFPAHTLPAAFVPGLRCPRLLSFVRCALKAQVFLLLFIAATESSSFFCRCSFALFPAACRFSAAFTQTLLCLFVWPALPARRALCARSSVLFWLSVCLFRVGCTRGFLLSLIFCPFLPNFFLSNFFSFVAQAATGLYFLPKRK